MTPPSADPVRTGPVRVFLVDDHESVRVELARYFGTLPAVEVIGEAGTVDLALSRIALLRPDVVITDYRLPDGTGLDVCRGVRASLPRTYCVVLTAYDNPHWVNESVLAGASGHVLKDPRLGLFTEHLVAVANGNYLFPPEVIENALRGAQSANTPVSMLATLTPRERTLLELIGQGLTNDQIAVDLHLSRKTVANYVSPLLAKLGVRRRAEATEIAVALRQLTSRRELPAADQVG
jgi:DNA-binding NarL/FixJ family response regulator